MISLPFGRPSTGSDQVDDQAEGGRRSVELALPLNVLDQNFRGCIYQMEEFCTRSMKR